MGMRAGYPGQTVGSIGRVYVELKFKLNGASAPTILSGSGLLSTTSPPAHVGGTNIYTITMRDPWLEVIYGASEPRDDANNGQYCSTGNFTNENSQASPPLPLSFKFAVFNAGGSVQNDSTLTVGTVLCLRNSGGTQYGNA